jgi:DNA-binding Lrp family transcriptional regulator
MVAMRHCLRKQYLLMCHNNNPSLILPVTLDMSGSYPNQTINTNKEANMVTSIILINAERTKINEVAEQIAGLDGISEVYSVSGNYDLIAIARVASNEELADLVTKKLLGINSILKSETMLAFKAFSRHDLETMFQIGME